ncbi:MAG: methyltransferase domain-containing protein [Ignavibacteriales bacterium]|nr:methyltransferase domain-containing protein [Ignavibacteriales bacterium]
MHYDPVKNIFASFIRAVPVFRIGFYKLLDTMFLRSWYVRRELRRIRKEQGNKKIAIYDAGSGYGQYSYFMAKNMQPCSIYSVDVKEDWINDCKAFFKSRSLDTVSFGVEDLTAINHKEKFDLIVCIDVMEHIHEDRTVFDNFFRALKPSGSVIINSPSIYGGSDVHDDHEESFIGEHARDGYSHEDLQEKMGKSGFAKFSHRYTYGFWGDKAWRLGIKYPMLMLNVSKVLLVLLPFYYLITFPFTFIMMYMDFTSDNKVGSGINFIATKKD